MNVVFCTDSNMITQSCIMLTSLQKNNKDEAINIYAILLNVSEKDRDILVKSFEGTKLSVQNMEGTYLAWLNCKQLNLSCESIERLFLKKAGVWLHKGSTFGIGGEGYMRLNLACPQKVLIKAIKQIKQVI